MKTIDNQHTTSGGDFTDRVISAIVIMLVVVTFVILIKYNRHDLQFTPFMIWAIVCYDLICIAAAIALLIRQGCARTFLKVDFILMILRDIAFCALGFVGLIGGNVAATGGVLGNIITWSFLNLLIYIVLFLLLRLKKQVSIESPPTDI